MKLTKAQAQELAYRLEIVADEQDLLDDYGITKGQAEALSASVPDKGGEWECPGWAVEVLRSELGTAVDIMRDIADSLLSGIALDPKFDEKRRKEARSIQREARGLERLLSAE
jgi:hypothetical protein